MTVTNDLTWRRLSEAEGFLTLGLPQKTLTILDSRTNWSSMPFEANLLAGLAYLLWRRRVNPMVPLSYIGTVLILSSIFYFINPNQFGTPLFHLLGGGLMLGALFMATDMVTSPSTMKGALIFGVGCGAVTMLIRYFGGLPEGVSYSILIMNAFKPLIDRISRPKPFGFVPKEAGKNG